ncbi:MAG: transcriptional repressor [Anaerolineae bacterium]|nr:transcriptional repressor [Anaerolineae bacterium]
MARSIVDTAADKLRAQGLRMTAQRRLVLEILEAANSHLDAEMLHQHARERDQSISLATVYRTLNLLHRAGIIEQRFLDQDHSRGYYEIHDESEHFHFTCLTCGKVIEFETDLVAQIRAELLEKYGVIVENTRIHFEGRCTRHPDCPQ